MTYLNTVFESLIETVNRHNGFVNKFLGDGFMAVFVSADGEDKHCRNAVLAAIKILEQVRSLVANNQIEDTKIGIGIHSGQVMTGNIGVIREARIHHHWRCSQPSFKIRATDETIRARDINV